MFGTVTATTGTLPTGLSSGSNYTIIPVNENRVRFATTSGTDIIFTSNGSANLVYRIQATLPNDLGNTIGIPGNTLLEGAAIQYQTGGGTAIGGLNNNTTYYVAFKKGDNFKMSTSANPYGAVGVCLAQSSIH